MATATHLFYVLARGRPDHKFVFLIGQGGLNAGWVLRGVQAGLGARAAASQVAP
jgi:hypothetical protein